jgi:hypothetical protein
MIFGGRPEQEDSRFRGNDGFDGSVIKLRKRPAAKLAAGWNVDFATKVVIG